MTAGVRWALFSGSGVSELFADTHLTAGRSQREEIEGKTFKPGVTKFTILGKTFKPAFTPLNLVQSSPSDPQNDQQDRPHLLKATCVF